jgi:hypothetical protein
MADRREHERFPVWALGRLWWDTDGEPHSIRIADLSIGGAAVELDGPLEGDSFYLQLGMRELQQPFPMEIVKAESTWHGTMIHARFGELRAVQAALLEATIEQWLEEYNTKLAKMLRGGGQAA